MLTASTARPAWARGRAIALIGCLALFAWINVEVINYFSVGATYDFSFSRMPARDLTVSVSWAVFALGLLIFGVRTKSVASRWTSLAFFLATIAKVFLYDLGFLRGLYRIGSLVGLAFALLAVSLLYQRFVFRREPVSKAPAPPPSLAQLTERESPRPQGIRAVAARAAKVPESPTLIGSRPSLTRPSLSFISPRAAFLPRERRRQPGAAPLREDAAGKSAQSGEKKTSAAARRATLPWAPRPQAAAVVDEV
jgi:hypothetical protein